MPLHGGVECNKETEQEKDCFVVPCPGDRVIGEWEEWGPCDPFCGAGSKRWSRNEASPARWGGAECEGIFFEEAGCQITPCPVDCEVGEWGAYGKFSPRADRHLDGTTGDCSVTCGEGTSVSYTHLTLPTICSV